MSLSDKPEWRKLSDTVRPSFSCSTAAALSLGAGRLSSNEPKPLHWAHTDRRRQSLGSHVPGGPRGPGGPGGPAEVIPGGPWQRIRHYWFLSWNALYHRSVELSISDKTGRQTSHHTVIHCPYWEAGDVWHTAGIWTSSNPENYKILYIDMFMFHQLLQIYFCTYQSVRNCGSEMPCCCLHKLFKQTVIATYDVIEVTVNTTLEHS